MTHDYLKANGLLVSVEENYGPPPAAPAPADDLLRDTREQLKSITEKLMAIEKMQEAKSKANPAPKPNPPSGSPTPPENKENKESK